MEYVFEVVFAIIALLLLYMHFETRGFEVNFVDVNKKNDGQKVMFSIVHISDLHFNMIFVDLKDLIARIREADAEIIVLSGDYIDSEIAKVRFLNFVEMLVDVGLPVFLVWGNHEHKVFDSAESLNEFRLEIESKGASVLVNENAIVKKNEKTLRIVGLDDLIYGLVDVKKAFFDDENFGQKNTNEVKVNDVICDASVILTHNPDMIYKVCEKEFDIMLCGHFHGGQIYMPFHLEFKLLRKERLCKSGIIKGLNFVQGRWMYINRGVGNVCFPFRFLSKPEIAVVKIYQ